MNENYGMQQAAQQAANVGLGFGSNQIVKEKTEIELYSDSIIGRTQALEDQINYLADALSSVLQPIPPSPQSASGIAKSALGLTPAQSQLGSKLAASSEHICRLIDKVIDLRERCKL